MSALDRIDFEALGRELIAFRRDFAHRLPPGLP